MSNFKTYAKSIIIPVLVGGIVGLIVSNYTDYIYLNKPLFSPPSIVFPIVWTILYILMGVSYGILKSKILNNEDSISIYYIQLFVNALWPIIFFTLKWRFFAFLWILLLLVLIVRMIAIFYKKNKVSAFLQIPYLLWTIFATYLTFFTYLLNK